MKYSQTDIVKKVCARRVKRKGILCTQVELNKIVSHFLKIGFEQLMEGYSWELLGTDIQLEINKYRPTVEQIKKLLTNPYYKHRMYNIDYMFTINAYSKFLNQNNIEFSAAPKVRKFLREEKIKKRTANFITRQPDYGQTA